MNLMPIEAFLWRVEAVVDGMLTALTDPDAPLTRVFWLSLAGLGALIFSVGVALAAAVGLWLGYFDPPVVRPATALTRAHGAAAGVVPAATTAMTTSPGGLVGDCTLRLEGHPDVPAVVAQLSGCLAALR